MDSMMLDGNGISVVIGASVAGIASLATVGMQIISFMDNRALKKQQDEIKALSVARDVQIKEVKDLVNGKSETLQAYVAKEAYEKGREHERLAPGTPSPVIAVAPVQSVVTGIGRSPEGVVAGPAQAGGAGPAPGIVPVTTPSGDGS